MKTLIIPDLHHHTGWVKGFLDQHPHDQVVFLGDYFDQFHDGPIQARETALWLKEMLQNKKAVFLFGNHDMGYAFPRNPWLTYCPGFSEEKREAIDNILKPEDWKKLKLHHWVDGWLLSHAGVSSHIFGGANDAVTREMIDQTCNEALANADSLEKVPALGCGFARGGWQFKGGIIWLCWSEFEPIPGLNQIVGHTPDPIPRKMILSSEKRDASGSQNHCIDTFCRYAGLLENGEFRIIETGVKRK